jgi:hypothetical protein
MNNNDTSNPLTPQIIEDLISFYEKVITQSV